MEGRLGVDFPVSPAFAESLKMSVSKRPAASIVSLAVLAACVVSPPPASPGMCTMWGSLKLVPRQGVTVTGGGGGSYADRRFAAIESVDYGKPGFAVVYLEGGPRPEETVRVSLEDSRFESRFKPAETAIGVGGKIVLKNESRVPHPFSAPDLGFFGLMQPGEEAELAVESPGPVRIFLLDAPDTGATVFAAPGPYSFVSPSGRWELRDVPPVKGTLRVWHARFPPTARVLDLAPGETLRMDLEIGVGIQGSAP